MLRGLYWCRIPYLIGFSSIRKGVNCQTSKWKHYVCTSCFVLQKIVLSDLIWFLENVSSAKWNKTITCFKILDHEITIKRKPKWNLIIQVPRERSILRPRRRPIGIGVSSEPEQEGLIKDWLWAKRKLGHELEFDDIKWPILKKNNNYDHKLNDSWWSKETLAALRLSPSTQRHLPFSLPLRSDAKKYPIHFAK